MDFLWQFAVVFLLVLFFHFIFQLLLMKKEGVKIQWKSLVVLIAISVVITLLFQIGDNGDIPEIEFPL